MMMNKLFLGHNSVVEITTKETVDEIRRRLATRYPFIRENPKAYFSRGYLLREEEDFGGNYVYRLRKNTISLFFAADLNRTWGHSFQVTYPWFTGNIVDLGDTRLIKGKIGLPEWTYYFTVLWFLIFGFAYAGGSPEKNGETSDIPLYFILFGLITLLIGIVRTRRKVDEMRDEIDQLFSITH